MANEPLNEILYKAAEKTIANGGGTVASPAVVVGNVASGATDSAAPVKTGGVFNSTSPVLTTGQRGDTQLDLSGNARVRLTGTAAAGADGFLNSSMVAVTGSAETVARALIVAPLVFNGTTLDRLRKPNAASRIPSAAASTNATSAKASAGDVHCISGFNAALTVRYLKFYAKATAPTVGTDTPVMTIALPVGAFNINLNGQYIATGIAYAMTTGAADADTGALTAGDILGLTITYA